MNRVIDIGNTRIKVAYFGKEGLIKLNYPDNEASLWEEIEAKEGPCILSTVRKTKVPALKNKVFELNSRLSLPFKSEYKSMETLGQDRIGLAAAAAIQFPEKDVLVIDAGTCSTYDLITKSVYQGGIISPGFQMRARAMHELTGKLPMTQAEDLPQGFLGRTTKECIALGAYGSFSWEMDFWIKSFLEQYPELFIVLTGGDAIRFENPSNYSIFADPNFLVKGLNEILKYNASAF